MEHFILDKYNPEEKKILLQLAKAAISYGLKHHQIMPVDLKKYSPKLQQNRACFVTLEIKRCLFQH